jgi:hypothetical protein
VLRGTSVLWLLCGRAVVGHCGETVGVGVGVGVGVVGLRRRKAISRVSGRSKAVEVERKVVERRGTTFICLRR